MTGFHLSSRFLWPLCLVLAGLLASQVQAATLLGPHMPADDFAQLPG